MKMKRAVLIAVLAVAVAALAVPLLGSRTHAAGSADAKSTAAARSAAIANNPLSVATANANASSSVEQSNQAGKIDAGVLKNLGIRRLPKGVDVKTASQKVAKKIAPNAEAIGHLTGGGPANSTPVVPGGGAGSKTHNSP